MVGVVDTHSAVDDAGGGKVRTRQVLHQLIDGQLGVVDQRDGRGDHFGQIVWRDVGGHAHRDACRAIDQQVREPCRHHRRLQLLLVVIGLEIDGFLVNVGHQLMRQARHPCFGVTHGCRRIAIHRTEVALPIDQQITQRERLRHANQGVVHRGIAVRVVLTDHVTDDTRGFVVRLVAMRAQFVHREQHAPMHGFQAIADIRQGAPDNHAHGVVEVAATHLVFEIDRDDFLCEFRHSFFQNLSLQINCLRRHPQDVSISGSGPEVALGIVPETAFATGLDGA